MRAKAAVVAMLALVTGACSQAGQLGDILGGVLGQPAGTETGNVTAEVQDVDTRNQYIRIRTNDGQTASVRYDAQTRVVYRQQEYSVPSLEAGDVVNMRVAQTSNNEYYTQYIEVQQSVQERGGYNPGGSSGTYDSARLYRLEGNITQIDYTRGWFTMRSRDGTTTMVSMPYNPRVSDRDRFERLRNGDFVRIEGRYMSNERIELERFM
jgi:hypothetical protein